MRKNVLGLFSVVCVFGLVLFGLLLTGCSEFDRFVEPLKDDDVEPVTPVVVEEVFESFGLENYGDDLNVYYINVSQGDSSLITYKNFSMLIDCGDNSRGGKVVEFLNDVGVSELDVLVATHAHADHIGGCDDVLNAVSVGKVYYNGMGYDSKTFDDFVFAAENRSVLDVVKWDFGFVVDDLRVDFLVAYDEGMGFFGNENDNSVVNCLSLGDEKFLFMGDCEKSCEEVVVNDLVSGRYVLKVGHHGSCTSSLESFIKVVQPLVSVISVGKDNKYGHPCNETVYRLAEYGVVYDTMNMSNIHFKEGVTYE